MEKGRTIGGVRILLSAHDFRRLVVSQAAGGLGEWLATMALIALVWERTGSAFISGAVLALRILPAAVLSGVFVMIAHRLDRRRMLIVCTAARALIYGSLPFVGGVAPVLGLALLAEVATLAYIAARDATVPRLVPSESLATANAISMASAFAAMPLGSGVFALMVWIQGRLFAPGVDLALLAAGGLLGLATLGLRRVAAHAMVEARVEPDATTTGQGRTVRQIFSADPVLRRVAAGGIVVACCGGSLLTLGLSYVRGTLDAGPAAYGGLLTAFCAGAVLGVALLQRARSQLAKLFHLSSVVMGAILLGMAVFPSTAVGYGMGFIFGAATVATILGGITIVQERVDDHARARTFAIAHAGLRVGAVLVGLLAAWAAHRLGAGAVLWTMDATQVVLAFAGLVLVVAGVLLLPRALPRRASA